MEIYINDSAAGRLVTHTVPVEPTTTPVVKLLKVNDDGTDYIVNSVSVVEDGDFHLISFTLPFKFAQWDRYIGISYEFDYEEDGNEEEYAHQSTVKVTTPILPLDEIKRILSIPAFGQTVTTADVKAIERATRWIIQANTGQDFGLYKEARTVRGSFAGLLELPGRLLDYSKVNNSTVVDGFRVTPSGRYIHRVNAFPNEFYASIGDPSPTIINGAVFNPRHPEPRSHAGSWTNQLIEGSWGWYSVPEDVQEAAKLLVNDYACSESAYRDRYLGVMKSADWEINYREGAWVRTGNVRADQLLAKYIITGGYGVL